MQQDKFLYQTIDAWRQGGFLKPIPDYIKNNFNFKIELRNYQVEAFENFINYYENKELSKNKQTHVLFHMATGSGKTLIMAGLILYLFEKGYRNFLFFVNSTNLIEKTKDNFVNKGFSKYVYSNNIEINGESISINQVNNFQSANKNDINIKFTTVQGLHSDIWFPKENQLTIDDFEYNNVAMISDEAHHINAETMRGSLTSSEKEVNKTWEYTVNNLLHANKNNILLEFTATCDLQNNNVQKKYIDKIIYDYPLARFRQSGYTKELSNMQTDDNPWSRTLQALIISQFRLKLFQENKINAKPVVLLKSRTIKDSSDFYEEYRKKLNSLTEDEILNIKNSENKDAVFNEIFSYFETIGVTANQLIEELKLDFNQNNSIVINSKNDSSNYKQKLVNSLEDSSNQYRIIFTVDMLNEGWDVLNLFDIVRLYETRQSKSGGKVSKFTIKEAQLIGRGARYYPFKLDEDQDKFVRKFDDDTKNSKRILETLFYHSKQDSRYIEELRKALKGIGLLSDYRQEINHSLKEDFKKTKLYKEGIVFANKRVKKSNKEINSISDDLKYLSASFSLSTGTIQLERFFTEDSSIKSTVNTSNVNISLKDISFNILYKAIRQYKSLKFNELKYAYPNLKSIEEFFYSKDYLGNNKVNIKKREDEKINNDIIYKAVLKLFDKVSSQLNTCDNVYKGSNEFYPRYISDVFKDKTRMLYITSKEGEGISQSDPNVSSDYRLDLSKKEWFAHNDNYGTEEEKRFISYFNEIVVSFEEKYDEVYILRNEREFPIYSFNSGNRFEPDYLLFLLIEGEIQDLQYQIFIEPKGAHLLENDQWKNAFLNEINDNAIVMKKFIDDKSYRIWGLPFYNHDITANKFETSIKRFVK